MEDEDTPNGFIAILLLSRWCSTFFAIETPIIESALVVYSTISNNLRTDNRWNYSSYRRCFRMLLFPKEYISPVLPLVLLTGLTYGLFLYNKPKVFNITLSVLIITLVIHLGLNTLWISILTGKAYRVLILPRIIKELLLIPVQIILIHFSWQYAGRKIREKFLLFNKN